MNLVDTSYFTGRGMRPCCKAVDFAAEIHRLIANVVLLEDFTLAEVVALGQYMPVFEADAGTYVITEGDRGDFMIVVIRGVIDVTRLDSAGKPSRIAVVQGGHALGEMSMLDGEPRFSSCIALEPTCFAVLSRSALTEVIHMQPAIGTKILVKLVYVLSQRLRNTSLKLVAMTEKEKATVGKIAVPL